MSGSATAPTRKHAAMLTVGTRWHYRGSKINSSWSLNVSFIWIYFIFALSSVCTEIDLLSQLCWYLCRDSVWYRRSAYSVYLLFLPPGGLAWPRVQKDLATDKTHPFYKKTHPLQYMTHPMRTHVDSWMYMPKVPNAKANLNSRSNKAPCSGRVMQVLYICMAYLQKPETLSVH